MTPHHAGRCPSHGRRPISGRNTDLAVSLLVAVSYFPVLLVRAFDMEAGLILYAKLVRFRTDNASSNVLFEIEVTQLFDEIIGKTSKTQHFAKVDVTHQLLPSIPERPLVAHRPKQIAWSMMDSRRSTLFSASPGPLLETPPCQSSQHQLSTISCPFSS